MVTTEDILKEREKTHGSYSLTAMIIQELKDVIRPHSDNLMVEQRESLDMICNKIGRILAGDPDEKDHWDDIAGYATLVSKTLDKPKLRKLLNEPTILDKGGCCGGC